MLSRSDKGKIGMQAADCFFAGTKDGVERRGSKWKMCFVFCLCSGLSHYTFSRIMAPAWSPPQVGPGLFSLVIHGNRKHMSLQHDTSPASLAGTQLCSSSFECTVYCLFLKLTGLSWIAIPNCKDCLFMFEYSIVFQFLNSLL